MRKINKPFRPIPEKLLMCFEEKQAYLLASKDNKQRKFDGNCYSASIKEDLNSIYHRKCAFCESELNEIPNHDYKFTVEHFRPKTHYFWLAYEWSNLMPACRKCNEKKEDKFPIVDKRKIQNLPSFFDDNGNELIDLDRCVANCEELLSEGAYLLHPELENPMDFLAFDVNNIGRFEEDGSMKAKRTIEICRLNRDDLSLNRKKIYDDFLVAIKEQLIILVENSDESTVFSERDFKIAFERIFKKMYAEAADEQISYCTFRLFLVENFDVLFIEKMPENLQGILIEAFLNFMEKLNV